MRGRAELGIPYGRLPGETRKAGSREHHGDGASAALAAGGKSSGVAVGWVVTLEAMRKGMVMAQLVTKEDISRLHKVFLDDMFGMPGGEKLKLCQQCGACSGSCPTSYLMDYTPREIIASLRAGMLDKIVNSNTMWMCASCYLCTVRCPAGIKITDMMYELKRLAIKYNLTGGTKNPAMTKIFINNVDSYGRNDEAMLMGKFILTQNWALPFKFASIGLKLVRTGRMPLRLPRSIRGRDELHEITAYLDAKEGAL